MRRRVAHAARCTKRCHGLHSVPALALLLIACVAACGKTSDSESKPAPTRESEPAPADDRLEDWQFNIVPDSEWPSGAYRFTVVVDGKTTVCEASLPDDDDANPCPGVDPGVSIGETGDSYSGVWVRGKPRLVELTIEKDGTSLYKGTFARKDAKPKGACTAPCAAVSELRLTF